MKYNNSTHINSQNSLKNINQKLFFLNIKQYVQNYNLYKDKKKRY